MNFKTANLFFLLLCLPLLYFLPRSALSYQSRFPSPEQIVPFKSSFSQDFLAVNLGMRRIFADIWFVRLMQYYGTPEEEEEEGHVHGPHCHHFNYGSGRYPDFYPMSVHLLSMDPYFENAVLYASASLAFNLERPEKAVALLKIALTHSPKKWKYLSMLAAIGYSKSRQPEKLADIFLDFLKEPDCPTMIKQLAAFLNKKVGNYGRAYFIYKDIFETSRNKYYVKNAKKQMTKLLPFIEKMRKQ